MNDTAKLIIGIVGFFALLLLLFLVGGGMFGMGGGMMGWGFGPLFMLLFLGLVVALVVSLVVWISNQGRR